MAEITKPHAVPSTPTGGRLDPDDRGPRGADWHKPLLRPSVLVLVLGLVVTGVLTAGARVGYLHNEQRLATLQTRLTGSLLATAPVVLQARLGKVAGLSAESSDPVGTYNKAIAPSMAPRGPFASSSLILVSNGHASVLAHVGLKPITSPEAASSTQLYESAAKTSDLVTTRVVRKRQQKLGYLVSARGGAGTFVVAAGQEIPLGHRTVVPQASPDANLNFALFYGRSTTQAALIETNVAQLPVPGTVSTITVPFGTSVLTLVASPQGSLSGTWSKFLPWGILGLGILFSLAAAAITERLVQRRRFAEAVASTSSELYREQRDVAEALQSALLPKALPNIPNVELAARYIPSAKGAEVGGDWYSVISTGTHRFAFVVGDVSGHGFGAASQMGALRYTVRTMAKLNFPVSEILEGANQEIDARDDDHFATALVGVVDTLRHEMTMATAGHPPPLLIKGQELQFLELPIGPPLGVASTGFESRTVAFEPGSTLLAYTDGLIERRGENIEQGLGRLAAIAADGAPSTDDLLTYFEGTLVGSENEDDVAMLAIRFLDGSSNHPVDRPAER